MNNFNDPKQLVISELTVKGFVLAPPYISYNPKANTVKEQWILHLDQQYRFEQMETLEQRIQHHISRWANVIEAKCVTFREGIDLVLQPWIFITFQN